MNKIKKLLAVGLSVMLIGSTGLVASSVSAEDYKSDYIIDENRTVDVTVVKQISTEHIQNMKENNAGEKLTASQITSDPNRNVLSGIAFRFYPLDTNKSKIKYTDELINTYKSDYSTKHTSAKDNKKFDADTVNTIMNRFKKDELGYVFYNPNEVTNNLGELTAESLFQGFWSIEEDPTESQLNSIVASTAHPCVIEIPITDATTRSEWLYTAYVYPKNENLNIVKDVQHLGNDHHTVDINEEHTWIVTSDLPDDIYEYTKTTSDGSIYKWNGYSNYQVVDTIEKELKYVRTQKVCLVVNSTNDTTKGTEIPLSLDTDYKVNVTENNDGTTTLTYTLTNEGRRKASPLVNSSLANSEGGLKLRIYYDAIVKSSIEDAKLGQPIFCAAKLNFTNSFDYSGERVSDKPEVHTSGIRVIKLDTDTKKPIKDTVFKIALTEEDAKNGVFLKEWQYDETTQSYVRNGEDITVTTDENGLALFRGLGYGDKASLQNSGDAKGTSFDTGSTEYWLVEIQSNTNDNGFTYQLQSKPMSVTCDNNSHQETSAFEVYDNVRTALSGGIGVFANNVASAAVMTISTLGIAIAFLQKKRMKLN